MVKIHRRELLAVSLIATFASSLMSLPSFAAIHGLSIDVLIWLRATTIGSRHSPAQSPVVVVALDEETYRSKPFAGSPSVAWTREIGAVVAAIVDGGAAVVGLDIVFPSTMEQSEIPFGSETVGAKLQGFDRDYLRALALTARQGKLVLGEVLAQGRSLAPSDAQRVAVSHQANIRPLNLHTDADGVVRRIPLSMTVDGERTPSMALELAARSRGTRVHFEDGVRIGNYRIPESVANTMTLNFEGGADEFPTYSFTDLRQCIESGDGAFFRRQFAGRVVILGVILELEDRIITSKRLATGIERASGERCARAAPSQQSGFIRNSISGVYVHATAVSNVLRQDALRETGVGAAWGTRFALSALAAYVPFAVGLPLAVSLFVMTSALLFVVGLAVFITGTVLPIISAQIAGALALVAAIGYKFMITDKDKRLLRRNFSFYLAPAIIEKMLSTDTAPQLGGEIRTVTLYRSDIAGFSTFSEQLTPSQLVELMNEYLTAMTDIIGANGGFVDKYIGDAIDGVFGAPIDDDDHALSAVKAALASETRLRVLNEARPASLQGRQLRQRIGLHTGDGLVGNIGSRQRFNYTVMGDAANLASRLEGVNKFYGTSIIVSSDTMERTGTAFVWRELDTIRVVGRQEPVRIFEPLALRGSETPWQRAVALTYARGLAGWRSGDFATALGAFAKFANADPPSAHFHARALRQSKSPTGSDWTAVHTLDSK